MRFASASIGYAFGASSETETSLYSTTDGGATWHAVGDNTSGITAVEPGPNGVFAVTGYRARPNHLLRVTPSSVKALPGAAQLPPGRAALAVHGRNAYAAVPSDVNGSGPGSFVAFDGTAVQARQLPCTGQSAGVGLAASGDTNIALICAGEASAGQQQKQAWTTANGGRAWSRAGDPPSPGYVASVAATSSGTFITGGRNAVLVTRDEGRSWPVSYNGKDGSQAGDSGYAAVGFVDDSHGFAIPDGGHEIDLTSDGGRTWSPSTFAG